MDGFGPGGGLGIFTVFIVGITERSGLGMDVVLVFGRDGGVGVGQVLVHAGHGLLLGRKSLNCSV